MSSATTKPAPPPPTRGEVPWTMPAVQVGQVVLWTWNRAGLQPSPALVLAVGTNTVNLAVHVDNVKDHVHKSGVRHKDDPFLDRSPEHDGGVWCLTERDQRIDELLKG